MRLMTPLARLRLLPRHRGTSWNLARRMKLAMGQSPPPPSHAEALVAYWLNLYIARKVSAEDCCVSMHHAFEFGMVEAGPYASKPGGQASHYSRVLKDALGYRSDSQVLYELPDNPCKLSGVMGRSTAGLIVIPAHEAFDEQASAEEADLRSRLRSAKENNGLPRCYYDHPVVSAHP